MSAASSTIQVMPRRYEGGERFEIKLAENPSTGYSWHLNDSADPDDRVVKMISSDFASGDAQDGRTGVPGTRTMIFEAVRSGTFELVSMPPGRNAGSASAVQSHTIEIQRRRAPYGGGYSGYFTGVALLGGALLLSRLSRW